MMFIKFMWLCAATKKMDAGRDSDISGRIPHLCRPQLRGQPFLPDTERAVLPIVQLVHVGNTVLARNNDVLRTSRPEYQIAGFHHAAKP